VAVVLVVVIAVAVVVQLVSQVGKVFRKGQLSGTYLRGPSAPEIAKDMMERAEQVAKEKKSARRR